MKILNIILAFTSILTIASCKKDAKPALSNDKSGYEINFNITGFTKEYSGIKTRAVKDTLILQDNYYKLYRVIRLLILDSTGTEVGNYIKTTDGSIKVRLQPGTYALYCVSAQDDDTRGLDRGEADGATHGTMDYSVKSRIAFFYRNIYNPTDFRESFVKSMPFTVGQTNQAINIVLERIVAQIQLNIKDAIPSNIKKISISIDSVSHVYNFGSKLYTLPDTWNLPVTGGRFTINSDLSGKSNLRFAIYALVKPNSTHNISIGAYDANDKLVASKALTDVTCNPNQITLLTGNLFGGNGTTTGTNVKVDSTWNSNIVYKSF